MENYPNKLEVEHKNIHTLTWLKSFPQAGVDSVDNSVGIKKRPCGRLQLLSDWSIAVTDGGIQATAQLR